YEGQYLVIAEHGSSLANRGIQKGAKFSTARRVTQFAQGLGFDLPDALAGDSEALAYFLKRVLASIIQAKAHFDHFLFTRRQGLEHCVGLLFQVDVNDGLSRRDYSAIFDEVSK